MTVYYLDPFKYLLGALVSFTTWNEEVVCNDSEYGYFDPPDGMTCGMYMSDFLQQATGYLDNPVSEQLVPPRIALMVAGVHRRLPLLWVQKWAGVSRRPQPPYTGIRMA